MVIPASLHPADVEWHVEQNRGRCMPTPFDLGTLYTFREVGDVLPVHAHPIGRHCHISIILKGSFELLREDDVVERVLKQGEIVDFNFDEHHGFRGLEAGALLLNIRKDVIRGTELQDIYTKLDFFSALCAHRADVSNVAAELKGIRASVDAIRDSGRVAN